jgi:dolichol-phosphate mannosyltransferase
MGTARYSIVVPLYNEQDVVAELCQRLRTAVARLHGPAEIIFVDDGSTDGTLGILKALQFEDKTIRVVSLSRNFGHQAAVSAGLCHPEGDVARVLDGDPRTRRSFCPSSSQSWKRDGTSRTASAAAARADLEAAGLLRPTGCSTGSPTSTSRSTPATSVR